MSDKQIPTELDWVEGRSECSTNHVFAELRYEIEKDVKVRDVLVTPGEREDHLEFVVKPLGQNCPDFAVHRNGADIWSYIEFKIEKHSIVVRDKGQTILTASLTFNDQGRCMLVVDGFELEHWQFRRRSLEKLFFDFSL